MSVHEDQVQALRDWAAGDSQALDRPVMDLPCPECDRFEICAHAISNFPTPVSGVTEELQQMWREAE